MRHRIPAAAGVAAIVLLGGACSGGSGTDGASPPPAHTASPSPAASSPAASPSGQASSPGGKAGFPVRVEGVLADVALRSTPGIPGQILVDGGGAIPEYMFDSDKDGKSLCNGACSQVWTPLPAVEGTKPVAGGGANQALIGEIKRADGSWQVTYNGHPLYYFDQDDAFSAAHGQGKTAFGGHWNVLDVAGDPVTAS